MCSARVPFAVILILIIEYRINQCVVNFYWIGNKVVLNKFCLLLRCGEKLKRQKVGVLIADFQFNGVSFAVFCNFNLVFALICLASNDCLTNFDAFFSDGQRQLAQLRLCLSQGV